MTSTQTTTKFNTMAILSFVSVFLAGPLAIIFGAVALNQIGRTGERGRLLAIWAIALGAIKIVGSIVRIFVLGWAVGGSGILNWVW
ncbi:DUF4190 domain-containing protein [Leifsonia poae]|uniref:DUF4190 domain-containing protein n=1 Tax=Leifsonia poae TaxID=110933 RepID=UPI003D68700A